VVFLSEVLLLFAAMLSLSVGAIVAIRNYRKMENLAFGGISLGLTFWAVGIAGFISTNDYSKALFWAKFYYLAPLILVFSSVIFAQNFLLPSSKSKLTTVFFALGAAGLSLPLLIQKNFITHQILERSYGKQVVLDKNQYIIYSVYLLACFTYTISLTFKKYKTVGQPRLRHHARLFLTGFCISCVLGVFFNLVLPGFGNYSLIVLGPLFSTIFLFTVAYAIVYRRLFDVRIVAARALVYVGSLAVLASIYGFIVFGTAILVFKLHFTLTTQVFLAAATGFAALFFVPIRKRFDQATSSIFFHNYYDPQILLNNLGGIMAREIELDRLSGDVLKEIVDQMRLTKASIVVLDDNGIFYENSTEQFHRKYMSREAIHLIDRSLVVKDSLDIERIPPVYQEYDIEVSVGLDSNNEFIGFLLLGAKKSGDIYNTSDIKTLRILANELAIAIHNARSYTQIQNFNKTLQTKVDEATQQLREANAHLKELDQIKNEFLSMATHQLNTPLVVVDGYLSMMKDGTISEPKEQHEFLDKILHRVRMMKHLVSDFLNVSRIEAGTFIVEPTPVDLNKMVTEQINELGPEAKEKEVFLQFIPPKHPVPFIEADEEKISQAVMNLIDNAIYYTPKGAVKVYLYEEGADIIFKVIDSGIGVPENQKAKLFQKFARADNARKARPNGNGVGLYLVRLVVEAHGGRIIFDSTEGKGSTFGFTIP
jgi:signal transduction histidine kinase